MNRRPYSAYAEVYYGRPGDEPEPYVVRLPATVEEQFWRDFQWELMQLWLFFEPAEVA